jgi:adenylyl- and sulfurtransferase ThiI
MDKTEIMDLARHIGTYQPSIQDSYACPFLPDHPLTRARVEKLREILEQMGETRAPSPPSGDELGERLIGNVQQG